MSNKKGGVKKGATLPANEMVKNIMTQVNAYNARYGELESGTLVLTTIRDQRIQATKVLAYSEQYAMDIALLACNDVFEAGAERLKRWNNVYIEKYREFQEAAEDERATTEYSKGEDVVAVYSRELLERELKRVCGKYYEPMNERYKVKIHYNGQIVAVTGVDVEYEVMSVLRGKTKDGTYHWGLKKPETEPEAENEKVLREE